MSKQEPGILCFTNGNRPSRKSSPPVRVRRTSSAEDRELRYKNADLPIQPPLKLNLNKALSVDYHIRLGAGHARQAFVIRQLKCDTTIVLDFTCEQFHSAATTDTAETSTWQDDVILASEFPNGLLRIVPLRFYVAVLETYRA